MDAYAIDLRGESTTITLWSEDSNKSFPMFLFLYSWVSEFLSPLHKASFLLDAN